MAAQDKVTFKQDLTEPVKIRHYEGVVFTGDDCGNLINVALFDGGAPYSGGGTVSATAVLADGTTFPLTQGSITGNMVSVPLEAGALAVSGLMGLYVKISGDGIICTVLNAIFTVQVTDTGMVPAAIVTTVNELVAAIRDAQDSIPADLTNLLAAVAPTFSTTTAYNAGAYVWQGGKLYRFTAAHPAGTWTGTDAVEVALGNDVADLKSALDYSDNVSAINSFTTGKYIATSGTTADITALVRNSKLKVAVVPCTEGDIFSVSGTGSSAGRLWAFLQENGTVITKSNASVTENGLLLVAPPNSAYLVVNINTDYASAVYRGYPMVDRLSDTLNSDAIADELVFNSFVSGHWVDGNGVTVPSSVYKMSTGFMRAVPGEYYITDQSEGYLRFVCYDKDMHYLGKTTLYTPAHPTIQPVISGTKWVRLTIATQESDPESVVIRRIDGRDAKLIQYPTVDSGVTVLANTTMTASGAIQTGTAGYHLAIIPHIQGETIYTSYNGANACIFKDASGAVMTREAPTSCTPIGTLNPIPTGADIAFVNLKVTTTGEGAWYSVILKTGYKKVLVIGDSVTWLDGRTGTKFAGTMKGFQAAIRKAGYLVDSMGYSGRPYAEYTGQAESETDEETFEDSIYKRIVTDQADVTEYDYIILFGGHNDIRLNSENPAWCPLGTPPTTYAEMQGTFDSTTFYGALSAIIKYCRDHNPTAQIIQWTVTQTESTTRPYLKTKEYRDAEISMSLFWDVPYVDMFSALNFTPFINYKSDSDTGSTGFHYDSSHPNYIGMERVGNVGLKALQLYD